MKPQNKQISLIITVLENQFFKQPLFARCKESTSLIQLKKTIYDMIDVPEDSQIIQIKGKYLLDDKEKLTNFGISESNNRIQLVCSDSKGFTMSDMKKQQTLLATKGQRNHRSIDPGLIFEAFCKNQKCKVFNRRCCVNKKLGTFDVGKQINKCVCPICGQKTKKAFQFYYYRCKIDIEGVKQDEEKFEFKGQAKGDEVKTFISDDQSMTQWDYITAVVSPL